jgi:hypothetical protein
VRRSPSVSSARSSSLRPCCPAPASVSRSLCCRPLFTAFPRSMHSCRPEVQPDRLCMRHRPIGRLQTAGSWLTPISRSTRTSTRWFPSPPGTTQLGVCCRHSKWTRKQAHQACDSGTARSTPQEVLALHQRSRQSERAAPATPVDIPLAISSMVAHRKEVGGVIRSGLRLALHGTQNPARKTVSPYLHERTLGPANDATFARLKRGGLHAVVV